MDHFTNYEWVIPSNKKSWDDLNSLKKCFFTNNIPEWHLTDKWWESKNNILENFCESTGITRINGVPYSPQHQVSEEVSDRTVSLPQQKTKKFLKESYYDFLKTITIESIRIRRWLHSEQWWIMRIKIWLI